MSDAKPATPEQIAAWMNVWLKTLPIHFSRKGEPESMGAYLSMINAHVAQLESALRAWEEYEKVKAKNLRDRPEAYYLTVARGQTRKALAASEPQAECSIRGCSNHADEGSEVRPDLCPVHRPSAGCATCSGHGWVPGRYPWRRDFRCPDCDPPGPRGGGRR